MNYFRSHRWVSWLSKQLIWSLPAGEGKVYLTFDDGPDPEVTPWVMEVLGEKGIKASFFCVGANIERYPSVFEQLKEQGHLVANHSYNHEKGWRTDASAYVKSVDQCERLIGNRIFRPPYGKITSTQIKLLKQRYTIVMWSLLSMDYDQKKDPNRLLSSLSKKVKAGDIIVFHDSQKAKKNLQKILPQFIDVAHSKGLKFELLPTELVTKT